MSVEIARTLLGYAAILSFVLAGFFLIIAGSSQVGRSWSKKLILIGIVLAGVASLVTPGWLP